MPRKSNPNNDIDTPKEPEMAEDYAAYAEQLQGKGSRSSNTEAKPDKKSVPYTEQVNALIKEVTVDEDGKFIYPDNTPEHLKYAVAAEKKYRDTQSAFTKGQMTLKEREAEAEALREQLTQNLVSKGFSKEELDHLEELKFTDPDAWYEEKGKIEKRNLSEHQGKLNEQMSEVKSKAGQKFELDRRVEVLQEFNAGRKNPITADILDNDVPPRIGKKLADGHLTFEGYLAEVDEYLNKGKSVARIDGGTGTSLSGGAGTSTPSGEAEQLEQGALDYASLTL